MPIRRTVTFTAPGQVELREEPLLALSAGQVLVETICSAISPGSEMLVYRGESPRNLPDEHDSISAALDYPVAYGYSAVGRVVELGSDVDRGWAGQLVFSFQPHTSHFISAPESLLKIPEGLTAEAACFLPSAETAVNLVQDAAPILGESVLVLGQGIIGLLTAALLAEFPLEALITADRYPLRRDASLALGTAAALDPTAPGFRDRVRSLLAPGADLTVEVSGSPSALDDAIALTRFSGRVVIGSWYGEKRAPLDLGGRFHRSRIRLISSQVSSIAPELSARWSKSRRFTVAWAALQRLQPGNWITHRFPIDRADEAYQLLDQTPEQAIQVVFDYPS
jgi:2-desacetyl-2-hydroxyethyl bacteriochlorophyllide A dehydrogenase